jgi:hypothetical protein
MMTLTQGQQYRSIQMQQWEYKIMTVYVDVQALDELGKDGWEMCGVSQSPQLYGTIIYFKRPKQQEKRSATEDISSVRTEQITDEQKSKLIKNTQEKQEDTQEKQEDTQEKQEDTQEK